jgi:predicted MFS family arabinose efflux permease
MIGWIGAGFTYGLAAGLSLAALLFLLRLPAHLVAPAGDRSPLADLREGVAFVTTHPHLRPIAITAIVFNIGFFTQQAIVVPYAHDRLGLSAGTIGLVLGLQGVGMVIGALIAHRVMTWLRFGWVIRIGPLCGFAAAILLLVTWLLPNLAIVAVAFLAVGIGPMLWTVSSTTLRQLATPDPMLGRVSAVITTATAGASPIGALLGAWLGSRYPLVVCLIVMVAAMALQATVISTSAPGRLRTVHDVAS